MAQRSELSYEVGIIGQRVTYSNGTIKTEEDMTGGCPPLIKSAAQESVRASKHPKGQSILATLTCSSTHPIMCLNISILLCGLSGSQSSRSSPATDVPEGVIGRGASLNIRIGELSTFL